MEITRWWMSANWKLCNVWSRTFILECQSTRIESWIKAAWLVKHGLWTFKFQWNSVEASNGCPPMCVTGFVTRSQQTAAACASHKTLEVFKPRKMLEWFNSFRRFSLLGDMEIKSNPQHVCMAMYGGWVMTALTAKTWRQQHHPREKRCERSKNIFGFRRLRFDSIIFLSSKTKKVEKGEIEPRKEL